MAERDNKWKKKSKRYTLSKEEKILKRERIRREAKKSWREELEYDEFEFDDPEEDYLEECVHADRKLTMKRGPDASSSDSDEYDASSSDSDEETREVEQIYGPKAYNLYKAALEDGIEEDSSIRINVVGNFGQGKSSLVNRLIGESIEGIQSTNGIDISRFKCKRGQAGEITYKENYDFDPSDIAERIKYVSVTTTGKQTKIEGYTPRDLSFEERINLCKVAKEATEQRPSKESSKVLDIWDFGGQYVFNATHTLFHSRKAIYILVFNLSVGLNNIVPNEDDDRYGDSSDRTMEYYIRFWVNSIHSFVGKKDGTKPRIILVGTHLNDLAGNKQSKHRKAKRYFFQVRELFKGQQARYHIHHKDFPLDNTDEFDDDFDALRDEIYRIGQEFAKTTRVPAKWIPLEKYLFSIKEYQIVPLKYITDIDEYTECPLGSTEQIKLFLKHHHDKGNFFFFDEEPISEYVVLEPQFLIDAFKCLITSERFIKNMPKIFGAWHTLQTEGKLENTLIDELWTNCGGMFMTYRKIILWFLHKHRIISEAMRFDEKTQTAVGLGWYIVPSLLKDHIKAAKIIELQEGKEQTKIQFVITFDNSAIVPTVYNRLIAAVLGEWAILEFEGEKFLFEKLSMVRIDTDHAGVIQMNGMHIHLSVLYLRPRRVVKRGIPDQLRRFAESFIKYEFRKFQKDTECNELPYTRGYTCNNKSHGVCGGRTITEFGQKLNKPVPMCPDLWSHDIDSDIAMSEWFQDNEALECESVEDLSDQTLNSLSLVIGKNWDGLGQALGISLVTIEHIEENYHRTSMRIYRMLRHWRDTFPDEAKLGTLITKLKNLPEVTVDWDGIKNIVDKIKKSSESKLLYSRE